MKNEFQSLSMDLFAQDALENPKFIVGGAATEAPNSGCVCPTAGGTETLGAGTSNEYTFTFTSDTQSYNGDGSTNTRDFQGVKP